MYVEDRISVNLQAFRVTYEQHVQKLVQDAVNSVKSYFDSAVQAMNDKADQVGRSTMQNKGMINVQIARIDDALSPLARLESASTSTFAAPNWSTGATTPRDSIVSKKELNEERERCEENTCFPRLGQRREDGEDVTDAEFHRWANGLGHNKLDLEWSLKQIYYFMNAKLVDGAKDIVRAEASKGNIRGA